jgi:hypothetical protein
MARLAITKPITNPTERLINTSGGRERTLASKRR